MKLILSFDPNKAHGRDGISARMILICDSPIATPLKIIFSKLPGKWNFPKDMEKREMSFLFTNIFQTIPEKL